MSWAARDFSISPGWKAVWGWNRFTFVGFHSPFYVLAQHIVLQEIPSCCGKSSKFMLREMTEFTLGVAAVVFSSVRLGYALWFPKPCYHGKPVGWNCLLPTALLLLEQPGDTAAFARGASRLRHFSQPGGVSRIRLVPRDEAGRES